MSKMFFVLSMSLFVLLLLGCISLVLSQKQQYAKNLATLFITTALTASIYTASQVSVKPMITTVLKGLYFASIDWTLLYLLYFVVVYADFSAYTTLLRRVFPLIAGIDLISMLANPVSHIVFSIESVGRNASGFEIWNISFGTLFYFHIFFCYLLIAVIGGILIMKMMESPRVYMKLYLQILLALVMIIVFHFFHQKHPDIFAWSVILYGIMDILILQEILYIIPKGLREKTLISAVEDMNNCIICFDIHDQCKFVNKKAKEMFPGCDFDFFREKYISWKKEHQLETGKTIFGWEELVEKNGKQGYFYFQYQKLLDEQEMPIGCFFRIEDRTEQNIEYQNEKYLATHDALTGLYNREYFFRKVEEELLKRPEQPRYMICTNIKNFKLINDLFGETLGDTVLKEQAIALMRANYPGTVHGRISNDRYAMLIDADKFNPELASKNTGRLQNLLAKYNYKLRVHIGIYKITDIDENPIIMYDKANMAIARIGDDFQKMFCFYDEAIMEELVNERNITSEFDYALESGQFCFYLQPQLDCENQLVGAEAVVRWNHPQRGLLQPKDFIPVLEKTGLIVKLDQYVWEEVVKKLSQWRDHHQKMVNISVNISAKDFFFLDLYEHFVQLVKRYGVEPKDLNLEITETVFMDDASMHMEVVSKLQNAGFSIEIDDFGSGYSSLNLLKDIQANKIKIDMLFLQETQNEERNQVILNAICEMAKKLEMPLIMEGIESTSQLTMMKNMGCQIFQGSYFSLPIPVSEFEEKYL